jgi:hypothetical protein
MALAHNRMRQASKAYEDSFAEAIKRQLDNVLVSTITEDTLNQEMGVAAQAHRDSIHRMTTIPPLIMDESRLQLCERYELKIDYITMDQVCTWSQY